MCALQHVRCVPPKHVPFSARRSCCSQPNRRVLGASFLRGSAWTYGHGLQGVAYQSGWEAPGGSACTVKGPYATQMRPGSLVRWGGGEKFAFMRCNVFPLPLPSAMCISVHKKFWSSLLNYVEIQKSLISHRISKKIQCIR